MNTSNWHWQFEAIGTVWVIDVYDPPLHLEEGGVLSQIKVLIVEFDKNYSRFRPDSLITQMSKESGEYFLPQDAEPLFDLYQQLYVFTGGAFTPLIGKTMEQAGYDPNYSLSAKALSATPTWEESMDYNFPKLMVKKPVVIDVGAGGKGYLIDLVGKHLQGLEISKYCIDAGQDILYRTKDSELLDVGLEDPADSKKVIGVAKISNQSICGSSGNRRAWAGFNHIIDPRTLSSPENILGVWVEAKNALLADALSTCLFFVSPDSLLSNFNFEWLIMFKDRSINRSSGFPAEIFTQ